MYLRVYIREESRTITRLISKKELKEGQKIFIKGLPGYAQVKKLYHNAVDNYIVVDLKNTQISEITWRYGVEE